MSNELGESVVADVRAIREAIDDEVGHDLKRLADGARRVGAAIRKEYGMKVADSLSLTSLKEARPADRAVGGTS